MKHAMQCAFLLAGLLTLFVMFSDGPPTAVSVSSGLKRKSVRILTIHATNRFHTLSKFLIVPSLIALILLVHLSPPFR